MAKKRKKKLTEQDVVNALAVLEGHDPSQYQRRYPGRNPLRRRGASAKPPAAVQPPTVAPIPNPAPPTPWDLSNQARAEMMAASRAAAYGQAPTGPMPTETVTPQQVGLMPQSGSVNFAPGPGAEPYVPPAYSPNIAPVSTQAPPAPVEPLPAIPEALQLAPQAPAPAPFVNPLQQTMPGAIAQAEGAVQAGAASMHPGFASPAEMGEMASNERELGQLRGQNAVAEREANERFREMRIRQAATPPPGTVGDPSGNGYYYGNPMASRGTGQGKRRNITSMTPSQRNAMGKHEALMAAREKAEAARMTARQHQLAAVQQRAQRLMAARGMQAAPAGTVPVNAGGGGLAQQLVSALGQGVQNVQNGALLAVNRMRAAARNQQRMAARDQAFANRGRMSRAQLVAHYR